MNVCVRRHPEAPVFFDEELRMGEDQWFITQNLERTAALGFCEKAKYIYVKNSSNSSGVGNNPLYAYQDMMSLYRFLMKSGVIDQRWPPIATRFFYTTWIGV